MSLKKQHLRNNLNDFDLSDDEFEDLRSEYEFEKSRREGPDKGARIAKIVGLLFLILASLFVIQQFFFPFGPDLTHILRIIPMSGTILVVLIGLGLLSHFRAGKKIGKRNKKTSAKPSDSGFANTGDEFSDDQAETAYSSAPHSEYYDPYALANTKRWYRSRKEKMIFGVCGGIAERFQIDPTIVRALFALAFFSYGFSFVIYIVLAIVMPKKPLELML